MAVRIHAAMRDHCCTRKCIPIASPTIATMIPATITPQSLRVWNVKPVSAEVGIKPLHDATDDVLAIVELLERVPFIGVNDELGIDAESLQRVPELERLR